MGIVKIGFMNIYLQIYYDHYHNACHKYSDNDYLYLVTINQLLDPQGMHNIKHIYKCFIYIHTYMHIHTYIHTCIHTHTYIHIYMYVCKKQAFF